MLTLIPADCKSLGPEDVKKAELKIPSGLLTPTKKYSFQDPIYAHWLKTVYFAK